MVLYSLITTSFIITATNDGNDGRKHASKYSAITFGNDIRTSRDIKKTRSCNSAQLFSSSLIFRIWMKWIPFKILFFKRAHYGSIRIETNFSKTFRIHFRFNEILIFMYFYNNYFTEQVEKNMWKSYKFTRAVNEWFYVSFAILAVKNVFWPFELF